MHISHICGSEAPSLPAVPPLPARTGDSRALTCPETATWLQTDGLN